MAILKRARPISNALPLAASPSPRADLFLARLLSLPDFNLLGSASRANGSEVQLELGQTLAKLCPRCDHPAQILKSVRGWKTVGIGKNFQ